MPGGKSTKAGPYHFKRPLMSSPACGLFSHWHVYELMEGKTAQDKNI